MYYSVYDTIVMRKDQSFMKSAAYCDVPVIFTNAIILMHREGAHVNGNVLQVIPMLLHDIFAKFYPISIIKDALGVMAACI